MSVTIYDVAAQAGVSISTVSNAINSPSRVGESTRRRVLAAIDELGYVPRSDARDRARRSVGRIGIIAPFLTYPSFEVRLRGAFEGIADKAIELVVYDQVSLTARHDLLSSLPLADRLDGLIVMALQFGDDIEARLAQHRVPTVLTEFSRPGFSSVELDESLGGQLAAQRFLDRGNERCAFIGERKLSPTLQVDAANRLSTFCATLAAAGVEVLPQHVVRSGPDAEEAEVVVGELLDAREPPTAVFAHSDTQAMGALQAIRIRGLDCPSDVAVIGFDDLDFARYVGLTTVAQPLRESGRLATELLLRQMNEPTTPPQRVILAPELAIRDTA